MKILISAILFFAGGCLFGQYSQQPPMQQSMPARSRTRNAGPSLRLHGYATYAFDDTLSKRIIPKHPILTELFHQRIKTEMYRLFVREGQIRSGHESALN